MITLVKENGIQQLSAYHWPEYMQKNAVTIHDDLPCILVNNSVDPYSLYISSLKHIGYANLNNRILITTEALNHAFKFHQSFDQLRLELKNHPVSGLKSKEIALLAYFYLNPLPHSLSLITRWFIDAGLEIIRASELARAAYTARTNREESELWFINADICCNTGAGDLFTESNHSITPLNLGDVLNLLQTSTDVTFSYDTLDQPIHNTVNSTLHINMERIDECGFLVEDHSIVIAGLAITVTEFAGLSETRWPVFQRLMIDSIPLYLRDFYSTGRLVSEKPDILLTLKQEHSCEIDLISIGQDGKILNNCLETWLLKAGGPDKRVEIPIYLQIRKS
ncbi:MAG: hypothetical protein IPF68_05670 [Bacteroidales bacterium]|nr:hypothetical protein [Bacteroidales bacterium]